MSFAVMFPPSVVRELYSNQTWLSLIVTLVKNDGFAGLLIGLMLEQSDNVLK